ncbi:MAG: NUDIX domain-containing protein [archaeon]
MMNEIVDVVNEDDEVIGTATRTEMREKNLLHRGGTIFVFNSEGEIFVHKRVKTKDIYPSYYDMTCGGGARTGETYEECAKRELGEELGIKDTELKFLFKFRYQNEIDNFFTKVYYCVYDGKITLQEEEVEEGRFMSIKELKKLMKKEKFCPDALVMFEKLEEKEEFMDVVNDNDEIIGTFTRKYIESENLLSRSVTILVFNSKNEIFVHKRTKTKKTFPGFFDLAVGGAVQTGEDYEEAAKREIEEELGIKNSKLKFLFKFKSKSGANDNFSSVYKCIYNGKITLQEEEVEEGYFLSIDKLKKLIKREKFHPESIETLKRYEKNKKISF